MELEELAFLRKGHRIEVTYDQENLAQGFREDGTYIGYVREINKHVLKTTDKNPLKKGFFFGKRRTFYLKGIQSLQVWHR